MALILIILALLFIPDPRYPDNRYEVHAIVFIVQKQRNTPVFLFMHLMSIVSKVQGITEYLKILVIRYTVSPNKKLSPNGPCQGGLGNVFLPYSPPDFEPRLHYG